MHNPSTATGNPGGLQTAFGNTSGLLPLFPSPRPQKGHPPTSPGTPGPAPSVPAAGQAAELAALRAAAGPRPQRPRAGGGRARAREAKRRLLPGSGGAWPRGRAKCPDVACFPCIPPPAPPHRLTPEARARRWPRSGRQKARVASGSLCGFVPEHPLRLTPELV